MEENGVNKIKNKEFFQLDYFDDPMNEFLDK